MSLGRETIVALATPRGVGGIGIVRVSGGAVPAIAGAILGALPQPRIATLGVFRNAAGEPIDRGLALYFAEPRSFTGEHLLELQGHGGPVVMDMLVARLLELGARPARAGEFSERAFLNGKLDLAQAEAVADLIESGSETAARCAMRSLSGAFSQRVRRVAARLVVLRTQVEAAIDFPEEEVDVVSGGELVRGLDEASRLLHQLARSTRQGCLLRDGMRVVIAGLPNAGKSSLFNALAEQDRAIVHARPGTTRDVIDQAIQLDGMPLEVVDTAGLRETEDEVEGEGVQRAHRAMQSADGILLVVDDSITPSLEPAVVSQLPAGSAVTLIRNKIDLTDRASGLSSQSGRHEVALSAKTGAGLQALREHLKASMGFQPVGESTFMARRRHLDAIEQTRGHLTAAATQLQAGNGELVAEELRLAHRCLGEIVGEFTSDDLLGRIFAEFCIGK